MKRYDPNNAPDPETWLELDEGERMLLVETYHRRARIKLPNRRLHAVIHTIVENQIALGNKLPVRRAIKRLRSEGLDRHEAIHAIGMLVTQHMMNLARSADDPPENAQAAYNEAVESLTVATWHAMCEADSQP